MKLAESSWKVRGEPNSLTVGVHLPQGKCLGRPFYLTSYGYAVVSQQTPASKWPSHPTSATWIRNSHRARGPK